MTYKNAYWYGDMGDFMEMLKENEQKTINAVDGKKFIIRRVK